MIFRAPSKGDWHERLVRVGWQMPSILIWSIQTDNTSAESATPREMNKCGGLWKWSLGVHEATY